jgi:hypothetical protein
MNHPTTNSRIPIPVSRFQNPDSRHLIPESKFRFPASRAPRASTSPPRAPRASPPRASRCPAMPGRADRRARALAPRAPRASTCPHSYARIMRDRAFARACRDVLIFRNMRHLASRLAILFSGATNGPDATAPRPPIATTRENRPQAGPIAVRSRAAGECVPQQNVKTS